MNAKSKAAGVLPLGRRLEPLVVIVLGILLYPLLAFINGLVTDFPGGAVLVEESVKTLVLVLAGIYGYRAEGRGRRARRIDLSPAEDFAGLSRRTVGRGPRRNRTEPPSPGELRASLSGVSRGLCLGLAAVALFAACENLAYFAAFPAGGIFGRLFWSGPLHLVASLAAAIGVSELLRGLVTRGKHHRLDVLRGLGVFLAGLLFALAWHLGANRLASNEVDIGLLAAGGAANLGGLLGLGTIFARRVVIGGFLYGAE